MVAAGQPRIPFFAFFFKRLRARLFICCRLKPLVIIHGLGALLGQIWGRWLPITYWVVDEVARKRAMRGRLWCAPSNTQSNEVVAACMSVPLVFRRGCEGVRDLGCLEEAVTGGMRSVAKLARCRAFRRRIKLGCDLRAPRWRWPALGFVGTGWRGSLDRRLAHSIPCRQSLCSLARV
jgi:hypothetical protein